MAFDKAKSVVAHPRLLKYNRLMLLKPLLQKFKLNEIRFGTLLMFLKDMFRTHSDRNIFGAKYAFKKEKSVVAHPTKNTTFERPDS